MMKKIKKDSLSDYNFHLPKRTSEKISAVDMAVCIKISRYIDVLQNREPFSKAALDVFLAASNRKFRGVLTAKSIMDIYYIIRRSLHDEQKTRAAVNKLFVLFDIADTFSADCRIAMSSPTSDYEDAVMIETAKRIGADCIVTRNLSDYDKSPVTFFLPKNFCRNLKKNRQNLKPDCKITIYLKLKGDVL